jgi:Domain of unknown function (DUF4419)
MAVLEKDTLVIVNQQLIDARRRGDGYRLDKQDVNYSLNNLKFLESVSGGKVEYTSCGQIASTTQYLRKSSNILMNAGYTAYADHLGYELTPDQLWYMIVDTIACAVNLTPKAYSHLLDPTWVEGKKKIVKVRNDEQTRNGEWLTSIGLFENKLKEFIPHLTQSFFTPHFTTSNDFTHLSNLLCLMDAGSTFYDYVVSTRCGVEAISLKGTAEDYQTILDNLAWVQEHFGQELGYYVSKITPVLERIVATIKTKHMDQEFWGNIIKIENLYGSGSPNFNGWLGYFTGYYVQQGKKVLKTEQKFFDNWSTECIPSHITVVPFIWDYYGTEYKMQFMGGPLGVSYNDDSFLAPEFGIAVASMPE